MFTNRLFSSFGHKVQQGMSHMRFARLLLVSIIALFAVVAPQTALAAGQPQIFTFHEEGSKLIDCGSFIGSEGFYLMSIGILCFPSTETAIQ